MLTIVLTAVVLTSLFRWCCLSILRSGAGRRHQRAVARAARLGFLEMPARLDCSDPEIDQIFELLERDYAVVTYLLRHAPFQRPALADRWHLAVLNLDFRLLRVWCALARPLSSRVVRSALLEMNAVVGHFASLVGERNLASARA